MAAPVVTGLAAFIMEYYPSLSAQQVKYCIEHSALPPPGKVKKPGSDNEWVDLTDISISGGIINAYEAIKMAATLSTTDAHRNDKFQKSTLSNKKD